MSCPLVPISIGELLDKITILLIKAEHTDNEYVQKELQDLTKIAQDLGVYKDEYINDLLRVNRELWDVEDEIRVHEDKWLFNDDFIRLARTVYITNDERAEIKKKINIETKSTYQEVKLY